MPLNHLKHKSTIDVTTTLNYKLNKVIVTFTDPLDFFLLDSVTGELRTAKPLDREALADPSSPLNLTVRVSTETEDRLS